LFRNSQRHQQCLQIYCKGNLVGNTNGTAVLGLGDIGPASKPVMEGKGLLFKIFC
jgi:malic enzyme